MRLHVIIALGLTSMFACIPLTSHASNMPRQCSKAEVLRPIDVNPEDIKAHRPFEIPSLVYESDDAPETYGFGVKLLIDETGHVACIEIDNSAGHTKMTYKRRSALRNISAWRYIPFEKNGAPVSAKIYEFFYEEEQLARHLAMPTGALQSVHISLSRQACYGYCPDYEVSLSGDGTARYEGKAFVDVTGSYTYKIDPEDVAALVKAVAREDIWSMRDQYAFNVPDLATNILSITIGGQTKTIVDYDGTSLGMPLAVRRMQNKVDEIAGTERLINFQSETLPLLRDIGFDFTGQAGANLLALALWNRRSTDEDAIMQLIDMGAPLKGADKHAYTSEFETTSSLVGMAIDKDLFRTVDALLARGALKTDGQVDQTLVNPAFERAVARGLMRHVEAIWPYSPTLTATVQKRSGRNVKTFVKPICLMLEGRPYKAAPWEGLAVIQFLLDKGGCDVHARDERGRTLLHVAAGARDIPFIRFLIDKGADVNAQDESGYSALLITIDEDTLIALLEAGADPALASKSGISLVRQAKIYKLERVLNWLKQHGYQG